MEAAMSDNPSTFDGESGRSSGVHWSDAASLHRLHDGEGLLYGFKAVRSGTLGDLVHFVMTLPEAEREKYCIEKAGDHRLTPGEIASLARRSDYPG
jgi:hypothetical protein